MITEPRDDRGSAVEVRDGDEHDAETVPVEREQLGGPVDPPDQARTVYGTIVGTRDHKRVPIVPAWLRNQQQRVQVAKWAAGYAGYVAAFHATRSPKYAAKMAVFAPWGLLRTIGRILAWAWAEEGNWHLRQHAATRGDADTWLKLDHARRRSASWRWTIVASCAVAAAVILATFVVLAPVWMQWTVVLAAVPVLAWAGRPATRPILDRVTIGPRFIKLTAELTRRALVACGVGIKDPADVHFPKDIGRDGPGQTAVVDLPPGLIATDVMDKRANLAAAFRLPLDQVWPSPMDGEHPGRLQIWVADRPVSRMKQPVWPLLEDGTTDYFEPYPYGFDIRLRPVTWSLAERNSLFGGVPGSGKTLAARNVLLGAVLDPLVIPAISELKGSGDYDMFEALCARGLYVSGADERSIANTVPIIDWLHELCEERGPLIARYARQGFNTVKKVNRRMAEHDERLRPVVAMFDEIQEFMSSPFGIKGGGAARLLSVIKRGRALGIHVIVATQRFDKDSLPKSISSLVTNRAALAVPAQPETDMILGTSAYRTGARPTAFVPGQDSGWMVRAGFAPGFETIRAAYVDDDAAAAVCARAVAMRQGAPDVAPVKASAYNLLDDVRAVWPGGEDALWSELIVPRLAQLRPELYGDWVTVEDGKQVINVSAFGAAMRAAGVEVKSVHRKLDGKGVTRYGVRLDALEAALRAREIE